MRTRQVCDVGRALALLLLVCLVVLSPHAAGAFTLQVVDGDGSPVSGFRYLVEEDNTVQTAPGVRVADSIGVSIHKSYAPVVAKGTATGSSVVIDLPATERYMVSVLPLADHAVGGKMIAAGATDVTVVCHAHPLPTAQISILVFEDNHPVNNAPDLDTEHGLQGFKVLLQDAGGQQMLDAFGNMLGTTYQRDTNGTYVLDGEGNPVVQTMGDGILLSDANGEVLIKNLAPGKFAVQIIPPPGTAWVQTSTIEGTPVVDAWVKAREPRFFVEGFGTGFNHVFYGFVDLDTFPWNLSPPSGTGSISGRLVNNHFARPPHLQGFFSGAPVSGGIVALNDPVTHRGLVAVETLEDGSFTIPNAPAGTYQLVYWDRDLLQLFGFATVVVPEGDGGGAPVDLGDVLAYRWFGHILGFVFDDVNENGFRDPGEAGIRDQAVNLRFRDGSIYKVQGTDPMGFYEFPDVFPFFKWLVLEVDFARFKATGMTAAVDQGGAIPPADGWTMPSFDLLNPQPQAEVNPNTGNNLSRTETGPVLTQAIHTFLSQTNVVDWGKKDYGPGENGGISGMVFYAATRAEDDPRYAGAEPWEPGIPRVQVNLYQDADVDGIIDDLDGDGFVTAADVDNFPFGWIDGGAMGPEDVDRNGNGVFDPGDAIQIGTTDSWNDAPPTGSIHPPFTLAGQETVNGFDNFGVWNQVRPGIFDGGFAFDSYVPGGLSGGGVEVDGLPKGAYVVEAVPPPHYEIVKEEDKNVDFGDVWTPSPLLLPPVAVGEPHLVPAELSLFPGIPAPYAGTLRPLANRKQVFVEERRNAAVEFFFFTEVPKAGRAVGFVNNDLAAEFDETSPIYGEKSAPAWIPISFQDWKGVEIARVYCDEFGAYNALLPASFSNNLGTPSGQALAMHTLILNHPLMPDPTDPTKRIVDPFYDPSYATVPWTFQYEPGRTTYLDTPNVPLAAFVGYPRSSLDVDAPDRTPVIGRVEGPSGGPLVSATGQTVSLYSAGTLIVPNPEIDIQNPASPANVSRDYSFGYDMGVVTVGGQPCEITAWAPDRIDFVVPADAETGEILVTRADSARLSRIGVTLHVAPAGAVHHVSQGGSIQAAIDGASSGDLVLVGPGVYSENVIMHKEVRLQGWGAHSCIINGAVLPTERLDAWHAKIASIYGSDRRQDFVAKEAPGIMVLGDTGSTFSGGGLVDGFTIFGTTTGGGIYVNGDAPDFQISNCRIEGNQGQYAGGIAVGTPDTGTVSNCPRIKIHRNRISRNGGVRGPGGIGLFDGATDYEVSDNFICGNFSRFGGGGIGHVGLSDGGKILRNEIVFNEVFFGALLAGAGDGGGVLISADVEPAEGAAPAIPGCGSVTLNGNLIQGNLAGSGNGGGIRAQFVNGPDVEAAPGDPDQWYALGLYNNIVVNNVAGLAGGGVALQDCARVLVVHNTIAHNDSTSTAALAFAPGSVVSTAHGAGLVSGPHSAALASASGQSFSDAVLVNNVLWQNRSFYSDGSLNGGAGGLVPRAASPYWDLAVDDGAGSFDPRHCLITDTTGTDATNVSSDPAFVASYDNQLVTAAVLDEGGNYINVRFTPIFVRAGDYHLTGSSPATQVGTEAVLASYPDVEKDYDHEVRPLATPFGISADHVAVPPPQADLDGDNVVDWADFDIIALHWGQSCTPGLPCQTDLNGDGVTGWEDFQLFIAGLQP